MSSDDGLTVIPCPQDCGGELRFDLQHRDHEARAKCEPPLDLSRSQAVCGAWWWWDAASEQWKLDPNISRFEEPAEPGELEW
jgi:hypothetical protein